MKQLLIIGFLLGIVSPAQAQVLQVDAGSSTLFNGTGAGATLFMPNSTLYGGIGYSDGHAVIGASDTFTWRDTIFTAGSNQLGFGLPGTGLSLEVDGISVSRRTPETTLTWFIGATGVGFVTPFVNTIRPQHFGTGFFLMHKWKTIRLFSLEAINDGQYTVAQGASLDWHRTVNLSGSGGLLNSVAFANGTATWHPVTGLNFYASHNIFESASGNSAGASFSYDRFSLQGSVNESSYQGKTVTGESIGGGVRIGPVNEQVSWFRSGGRTLVSSNSSETLHHLTLNQTVTNSSGKNAYTFGGGYSSNRLGVSLTHSIIFLLNGEGFAQVSGVQVSLRIHDTTFNVSNVTTPLGKNLWSMYGTNYSQLGAAVPGHTVHVAVGGKFLITGTVKDSVGDPVEGAAIQIGKVICYSNAEGFFSVRAKTVKAQPMMALPAVFATPGNWAVASAPLEVSPNTAVNIVVKRLP